MKTLGTRLAVWYALASALTLACLFLLGYFLLERQLIHGLDLLNEAEFTQIRAVLGQDYQNLTPAEIKARVEKTTETASVLFYIQIHRRGPIIVFRSENLRGRSLPDVKGKHIFDGTLPGIGELHVQEFILDKLEVQVATSLASVRQVMTSYIEISLMLIVIVMVVSGAIGYGLSRLALRPIRLIQETARHIGSDNLGERIPVADVQDEVSNLARLLNRMFDRLESSFNQIRRFAAEASHELKTPLSLVRLQAEKLLVEGGLTPAQEEAVQAQMEEITQLHKIIEDLLFLSRAEAGAITLGLKPGDPQAFIRGFAPDARALAEYHGLRFVEAANEPGGAAFDAGWIRHVLLNLFSNAINASPPHGRITLASEVTEKTWRVSIADEGPGVPADQRDRIFERFVRLNPNSRQSGGSGLGLAICRGIIELHKGKIRAEPAAEGTGLRVIFEIPARPATAPSAPNEAAADAAVSRPSRSAGREA